MNVNQHGFNVEDFKQNIQKLKAAMDTRLAQLPTWFLVTNLDKLFKDIPIHVDSLEQLFFENTRDGDLICKDERNKMVQLGICCRVGGVNWLTEYGRDIYLNGILNSRKSRE